MSLTHQNLYRYQKQAINWQCTHPYSMLWIDKGLGKTIITLTSIVHLLAHAFLRGVLIVAPIRVARLVWRKEAAKWRHARDLSFSLIIGTQDQRLRALKHKADIYLINYENLRWLFDTLQRYFVRRKKPLPFNGLVWDEVTHCKNSTAQRVRAVKRHLDAFDWITGLTGGPAPNGYKDLHGQYLVVDKGERLGTSKTRYRETYFKENNYRLTPYKDTPAIIQSKIADITLQMSEADYNPLPPVIPNDVIVEMPKKLKAQYEQLEQDFFLKTDNGALVEVFNKASLGTKCLQFSNGAVYLVPGQRQWEAIHDLKLQALRELVIEAAGHPVLCAYAFAHDAQRIMKAFKDHDPINLTACRTETTLNRAMHRWQTNDCALMIGHPASMGHGIDGLQETGHICIWFGLTWALDLYEQFIARLRRTGQTRPVICHRILTLDTMDMAQAMALDNKAETEDELRQQIAAYRRMKYAA